MAVRGGRGEGRRRVRAVSTSVFKPESTPRGLVRGSIELRKVKIGFPRWPRDGPRLSGRPRRRARARRPRRPRRPDYCFFVHVSKTGRPVNRNLNAINANARSATEMSMIAVMAFLNGLSRKP